MDATREATIDRVELRAGSPEDAARGLLGFLTFRLNRAFHVSGIALRRTQEGRLALSFPAKRDAFGQQHFLIRPLDDDVREAVEDQVFRALALID